MPILSIVATHVSSNQLSNSNKTAKESFDDVIVRRILVEFSENPRKWSGLALHHVEFTAPVANALHTILKHETLKEMNLYHCPYNAYLEAVLKSITDFGSVEQLTIHGKLYRRHFSEENLNMSCFPWLGTETCKLLNLTRLRLCSLEVSAEDATGLSRLLCEQKTSQHSSCPLEHLVMSNIRFSTTHYTPPGGAFSILCGGLSQNETLTTLSLIGCGLQDGSIAQVAKAMEGHSKLTHLCLSWNLCRKTGLQALTKLLFPASQSQCRLCSLDLKYQTPNGLDKLNLEWMRQYNLETPHHVQRQNCHLEKLILSGNCLDDNDMAHLAASLPGFAALKEIDLESNAITSCGLETLLARAESQSLSHEEHQHGSIPKGSSFPQPNAPSSSRLRTLRLAMNPLARKGSPPDTLIRLLQRYPELHTVHSTHKDVWKFFHRSKDSWKNYLIQINQAGRILLLQNPLGDIPNTQQYLLRTIAVSVWPLVLAKCNLRRYGANAMYYLLRFGPVLLETQMNYHPVTAQRSLRKRQRKDVQQIENPTKYGFETERHSSRTSVGQKC